MEQNIYFLDLLIPSKLEEYGPVSHWYVSEKFSPLSLRFCTYNVLYKREVEDPPVYVIFTYLKGINVKVNPHTLEW